MSDSESHPVAAGARVAEALPLVEALLAQAVPRTEVTVAVTVVAGSHAVGAYRAMTPPGATTNYELHIPAQHVTEYVAVLDPLIVDDARRWPELGVDDGAGGRWLSVHGTEPAALDAFTGLPEVSVEITVTGIPRASMSRGLIPAETDPVRAGVEWGAWWPAVPELGLPPHSKHAAVYLFVNSSGLWELERAEPGFRLYVVTERNGGARAAHLAAAAGLAVITA